MEKAKIFLWRIQLITSHILIEVKLSAIET